MCLDQKVTGTEIWETEKPILQKRKEHEEIEV